MLEQIKLNLYYFFKTSWLTIVTFWAIYLGFIGLMAVIALSNKGGNITIIGFNVFPSLIFSFIFGIFFLKDTFPHVIKLGVDRYSYVLSLFSYIVLFTIIMTTISQISLFIIDKLITLFSLNNFQFTGIEMIGIDNIGTIDIILYEAFLYVFFFSFSLLLGSIFFRFGIKIGMTTLAIFPLLTAVQPLMEFIFELLEYVAIGHENYNEFAFLAPYAGIGILIWLIISKASVIDKTAK